MERETGHDRIKAIVHLLRRLMQAGEHYTKELDKKYQVSAPQLVCLLTLYEHGPLSPSQIAKHIMVNSSTVTGIIDRLEQKGLVQRIRKSRDRRVINIELTEAGKDLSKHAPPPIQQKIVDGIARLPEEDINEIIRGLTKLTYMLESEQVDMAEPI